MRYPGIKSTLGFLQDRKGFDDETHDNQDRRQCDPAETKQLRIPDFGICCGTARHTPEANENKPDPDKHQDIVLSPKREIQ